MTPLRVYVAGPYTRGDVAANVAAAVKAGQELLSAGHIPFVPHLTHFWHLLHHNPYEAWLAYDLEWLKLCDVVVRLPGESAGADKEVAWAEAKGLPVFPSVASFLTWEATP